MFTIAETPFYIFFNNISYYPITSETQEPEALLQVCILIAGKET